MVLRLPDSWSNWNLEMLVFEETGKPEYPEKNLSEQRREPTTNSTQIWRRRWDSNPGHIGGRRALSSLPHPLLSKKIFLSRNTSPKFFSSPTVTIVFTGFLKQKLCPFQTLRLCFILINNSLSFANSSFEIFIKYLPTKKA